jgi:hypothetical protein
VASGVIPNLAVNLSAASTANEAGISTKPANSSRNLNRIRRGEVCQQPLDLFRKNPRNLLTISYIGKTRRRRTKKRTLNQTPAAAAVTATQTAQAVMMAVTSSRRSRKSKKPQPNPRQVFNSVVGHGIIHLEEADLTRRRKAKQETNLTTGPTFIEQASSYSCLWRPDGAALRPTSTASNPITKLSYSNQTDNRTTTYSNQ